MRAILLALLAGACTPGFAATVYKCTDAAGQKVFSDRPCASDAAALEIKDNRIGGSFSPGQQWIEENNRQRKAAEINRRYDQALREIAKGHCKEFSSTELRTMVIGNTVVVGMNGGDAVRAWGKPTRINGSQHAYHWSKGGSSYFYVEDGCVRTVQGDYNG